MIKARLLYTSLDGMQKRQLNRTWAICVKVLAAVIILNVSLLKVVLRYGQSFLPLLAFHPLSAKYIWKFSVGMHWVKYMLVIYFLFFLFMFQCDVYHCLGTGLFSNLQGSCWPHPGVVPCFVSRFLYIYLVVPAKEGCATFHVVYMLWYTLDYVQIWFPTFDLL